MSSLLIINGVEIKDPSIYNAGTYTKVEMTENAAGYKIGSIIRENVAEINVSWDKLTVKEWSDINKMFLSEYNGSVIVEVTFLNQVTGEYTTRNMITDKRAAGLASKDDKDNVVGWYDCQLKLIEV